MTLFNWRGPLTAKEGSSLVPGRTVELDPADPLVKGYQELGYLEALPTPKKSKKGDA